MGTWAILNLMTGKEEGNSNNIEHFELMTNFNFNYQHDNQLSYALSCDHQAKQGGVHMFMCSCVETMNKEQR